MGPRLLLLLACLLGLAVLCPVGARADDDISTSRCYVDYETYAGDHARYDCKVKLLKGDKVELDYSPCGDPGGFNAHRRAYGVSYSDYQDHAVNRRIRLHDRKLRVRGRVGHKSLTLRNRTPFAVYVEYSVRCEISG